MDIPVFNSKVLSDGKSYILTDPVDRLKYFHSKAGAKIEALKTYIDEGNTFVGYLLAKKMAGKGTYSKMVEEMLGPDRFVHISVGDVVRNTHAALIDPLKKEDTTKLIKTHYRGVLPVEQAIDSILTRSQDKVSVTTEMILTLLKIEIDRVGKKALFIDGLPRSLDQISYSLYFRDLINYRYDPDFFIIIDVPEEIISSRMQNRVICPVCHTSKNVLINPTKYVGYDNASGKVYFLCDNSNCAGYGTAKYVEKEGDSAGIESIRERLTLDGQLMDMALKLDGIPKVTVKSAVPIEVAHEVLDDYEIQESYTYTHSGLEVSIIKEPWAFTDDNGVKSYTYYAATYALNIIIQIHDLILGIN